MGGEEETGGFAYCARAVNAEFGLSGRAGYVRQDLDRWHRRQTRNAAGEPPPPPVRVRKHAKRTTPRLLFRPADWAAWVRPGVPSGRSNQFRPLFETPAERRAWFAGLDTPLDR